MIEELVRHRCSGDDCTPLVVIEHCYVFTTRDKRGVRRHRGAAWSTLLNGEPVRYIDGKTFEVIATGELLSHDIGWCDCAPIVKFSTRGDDCKSLAG